MTLAEAGFAAAGATAILAMLAAVLLPRSMRVAAVGVLTAYAAACGLLAAAAVLVTGEPMVADLPDLLPLAGVRLELDALGAVFVLAAALVAIPSSIYAIGYCADGQGLDGRAVQATYPLFVWTLLAVPAAGSASTFLLFWELMALSSLLLLLADHRHNPAVRSAGQWYGALTQLGFVAILLAFALLAGSSPAGDSFAALRASASAGQFAEPLQATVFVLALIGFGSKAGAVPLHVWLPRAHPEAPSHVSALMSGAMVKLGIYGILRVGWDLMGGGPRWWGLALLAVGAISALFGILHALVASDLKRLLAYSTIENTGLILIGVGAGGLMAASGNAPVAALAVGAALLHVLNHAVFKGLLFLGAGSVAAATGTRDLDRLGGLGRRMPVTAATFAVGALAIAALPPLNGFVSEWLLLQALVHSLPSTTALVAVTMPVAVAVVALTGGLAAVTFVKAFGTGFLALPRSRPAEEAAESPWTMRSAVVALAGLCVVLGIVPSLLGRPLGRALAVLAPFDDRRLLVSRGFRLELDGVQSSLSPVLLAAGLVVALVAVAGLVRLVWSAGTVRGGETWGCGRSLQTARMEYTATSYAEPLQRVFDEVLRPDLDVDVSHRAASRYYVETVRYRRGIRDACEHWFYRPAQAAAAWWGELARGLQSGSVHRYLAYVMAALLAVLVVGR